MSLVANPVYSTIINYDFALEPVVRAHVEKNFGVGLGEYYEEFPRLSNSTFSNYSKLIVPLYCSMILSCYSWFPVAWFKDGKRIESDNITNHTFDYQPDLSDYPNDWPNNLRRNHSMAYSIEGHIEKFNSTLTISNVTRAMEGSWVCKHQTFDGVTLGTVLDIMVDTTPGPTLASTGARILLSVVEELSYYRDDEIYISFLYFLPQNAECDVYFILPNKERVNYPSSTNNFEMYIQPHEFSLYLRCATLHVTTTLETEGDYQFVIEQHIGNETKRFIRPFKLKLYRDHSDMAEELSTDHFRAYLMVGRVYLVTFWYLYPEIMAKLPINASIDVFSQLSPSDGCGYKPVLAADVTRECGIVSVVTGQNDGTVINVILNVTKSCTILSHIVANDSTLKTTFLNITAVEESFSTAKIEPTVVIEMPNEGRGSSVKLTNETFQLRCLVPVCDWEVVEWCKSDANKNCARYTWNRDRITKVGIVAEDPNITARFQPLNNYTAALDLSIKSVQLNHTGVYTCGMYGVGGSMNTLTSDNHFESFRLIVEDRVKPTILNARNGVEYFVIKKGGEQVLLCQVKETILPTTITWRQYSDDSNFEHENGNDNATLITSNTNKTSLVISKPGLFECQANNSYGVTRKKFRVNYDQSGASTISTIPIAVAISVALAVTLAVPLSIFGFIVWRKYRNRKALFEQPHDRIVEVPENVALTNDKPLNDQASSIAYDPTFEIHRESFVLIKNLGEGEFGKIFEGVKCDQSGNKRCVAVKVPLNSSDPQHSLALFSEMLIMAKLRPHVNVLSLIGYCTKDIKRGRLFVLTELCRLGSLRDYIITQYGHYSNDRELPVLELLTYAYQAANGMEHLATHTPPILHRDLALRNLLLTSEKLVKVSDFGLSRLDENYCSAQSTPKALPVLWMALESLIERKFTPESDVWSFGVVLWELFSLGGVPHARHQLKGVEGLQDWLSEGNRLEKPMEHTPEDTYQLMLDCWNKHPSDRPTFSECKRRIASSTGMTRGGYAQLILQLNNSWIFITSESNLQLTADNANLRVAGMFRRVEERNVEEGNTNGPNADTEMTEHKNKQVQECNLQASPYSHLYVSSGSW